MNKGLQGGEFWNVTGRLRPRAPSHASSAIAATHRWIAERSPVRARAFVMGLLFCSALIVGYALLPGDSERIAMLERDGKTREARQILEIGFAAGDRRQRTLYQLQGLYEQSGDLLKARQMLELLAERRPRDQVLQRQLGQFYKQTHDEPAYIRSLLQQIDIRYSENACREVIGLLRRSGAFGQEQAALQKCRQKGYRRPDDMVRLASLMAAGGDIKEASLLMRAVDDLRRLKSDRERLQLFALLLDIDQPNEAQRRAARWVKGSKDDTMALTLIHTLVLANRHDLAIELARETSVPGDSVFLAVAEVMIERGEMIAAQAILQGWLDKVAKIEPPVASRFIAAALNAGSPTLALAGAQRVGLAGLQPEAVVDMARGLDDIGRRADASALRASLGLEGRETAVKPIARERLRALTGFRIAALDGWRNGLWKRLAQENKIAAQAALRPVRGAKDLKALRQAKRLSIYRKRFVPGAAPKPADTSGFNPFKIN